MISEKFHQLDAFLLFKVCYPAAKWLDFRFHMNPAEVACKIFMASAILTLFDAILNHSIDPIWFSCLLTVIILAIRAFDIHRLSKISEQMESRPNIIPAAMILYIMPMSRMIHLGWSLISVPTDALASGLRYHDLLSFSMHFVPRCWFAIAGIAYYFAALPRPPAKRKEKKVHAPFGAQLAGIKS